MSDEIDEDDLELDDAGIAERCFVEAADLILQGCNIPRTNDDEHHIGEYALPFENTPARFGRALLELTAGHRDPMPDLRTFEYHGEPQLIVSAHNQAYCLCPHHLLAVELSCSVGYVGFSKVLGLSKIPRLIKWAASRLTTQEDLAQLLANELSKATSAEAIFINIEGTHSCMRARGIKTNGNVITYLSHGSETTRWQQAFQRSLNR